MARFRSRRGGRRRGNRRYSKRSSMSRSIRRRNRSSGIRRYGKVMRRKMAGSRIRRWKKYYFERQTDIMYQNISTSTGADLQVTSGYSPNVAVGNHVTAAVLDSTTNVAPGCINWSAGMLFKLSNLQNVSEFVSTAPPPAGLFEEYKLRKVCIEITPVYAGKPVKGRDIIKSDPVDDDAVEVEYTYPTPTMYFVKDYDNAASMNWPMISEMAGVQRIKLNKTHRIWVDPKVVVPVASTALGPSVFASTAPKSMWITNKNLNVEHYGLRFYMQDWPGPADNASVFEGTLPAPVPYQVRLNIRYFFACRGSI